MTRDDEIYIPVLESFGATEIKGYCLVNNWGYTFTIKGCKYDSRFWENCYGASPMIWDCSPFVSDRDKADLELAKRIAKALNDKR